MNKLTLVAALLAISTAAMAQPQPTKMTPESSEIWTPEPRVVSANASGVPSDAVVLFDGKNLDNWVSDKDKTSPAPWTVSADGAMVIAPGKGDVRTKQEFNSYQLHIEWRTPAVVESSGQGRGNSGIFMQGLYELQVLDSYNNRTYSNGQAGSIYKQSMPLVNAARKPGEWQVYDVIYTAPHFNKDGYMAVPPYITVFHNGIVIQNHTMIRGTTPYIGLPVVAPHGAGPIKLQDHGNTTAYRNIWIREL